MIQTKFSKVQLIKFTFFTVLFFLLVIVALGEAVVRAFAESSAYYDKAALNDELGWVPKANYEASYTMTSKPAPEVKPKPPSYNVNFTSGEYGFRTWGDTSSPKPKVLFLGDSYIQAVEVSNDKAFYNLIADSLGLEVFALGQAGYGNLQELLMLRQYIGTVNPDLVVLQTCDNDFIDNYAPLEYNSGYRVGLRRPYLKSNGKIILKTAVPRWKEILHKSKFLKLLHGKIEQTFPAENKISAEEHINDEGKDYQPYKESIAITKMIMKQIKQAAGEVPVIAFSASEFQPQLNDMKVLCEAVGIPYLDEPAILLRNKKWAYELVNSSDGYHWNEYGHRLMAHYLKADISKALNINPK